MDKFANSTFHIIECNGDISEALGHLLESYDWRVDRHIDYDKFLAAPHIKISDILVFNLNHNDPHVFQFADKLIKTEDRPSILMTCAESSPILTSDVFSTSRVEILSQPFSAGDFNISVQRLKNQIYPINE